MIQATSFPTIQVPTIDVFFLSAQHQVFRFHISYNRWHDLEKFHITCTFDNRNKSHNLYVHNAKYPRQKARYRIIKVVRNEMSKQHCFLVNMKIHVHSNVYHEIHKVFDYMNYLFHFILSHRNYNIQTIPISICAPCLCCQC